MDLWILHVFILGAERQYNLWFAFFLLEDKKNNATTAPFPLPPLVGYKLKSQINHFPQGWIQRGGGLTFFFNFNATRADFFTITWPVRFWSFALNIFLPGRKQWLNKFLADMVYPPHRSRGHYSYVFPKPTCFPGQARILDFFQGGAKGQCLVNLREIFLWIVNFCEFARESQSQIFFNAILAII